MRRSEPIPPWSLTPAFRRAPAVFRAAAVMASRCWRRGSLIVRLPSGEAFRIDGPEPGPLGQLWVSDYRFVSRVLAAADIGFGEGFVAREWDTPDLSALLCAFTANFDALGRLVDGNVLTRGLTRLADALRRNTRRGARRNVHDHYDLGNAFYACWLDAGMTYSSAVFERPDQSLKDAQDGKYAALADHIDLRPGQHLLEIGCGWGGFAEFAAARRGARVTGITLSREQCEFARRRIFDQGLSDQVDIRLADYREMGGSFDKVASIEMFEAVGEAYWPAYFGKVREVLKPAGRAGIQVITIRDELFPIYRRRSDFLRRYIFPGGMLPSEARLREETAKAGLEWRAIQRFGQNYAQTLAEWSRRFEEAWEEIRRLGFDERFRRLWRFYLGYCEAGMRTERTNVVQLALARA